jgi:hypothetical protein
MWTMGLIGAASLALVVHTLLDVDGWQRRDRLRGELAGLEALNCSKQATVQTMTEEIEALGQPGQAQEHAIRDELGWVRDNQELVIVE